MGGTNQLNGEINYRHIGMELLEQRPAFIAYVRRVDYIILDGYA